jgi:hypothetical protein
MIFKTENINCSRSWSRGWSGGWGYSWSLSWDKSGVYKKSWSGSRSKIK